MRLDSRACSGLLQTLELLLVGRNGAGDRDDVAGPAEDLLERESGDLQVGLDRLRCAADEALAPRTIEPHRELALGQQLTEWTSVGAGGCRGGLHQVHPP